MARSLDNSTSQASPRRETPRAAPYLTHELTHHGQVTLIPPQNAGRIRKAKLKGETNSPRHSEIPEYPPPTFQEAILTPPVSPDALAYGSSSAISYNGPSSSGPLAVVTQPTHLASVGRFAENADTPSAASSPGLPATAHPQATPSISPLVLSAAPSPQPPRSPLHRSAAIATRAFNSSPTPPHSRAPLESYQGPQIPVESGTDADDAGSGSDSDVASSRFMTPEPESQWEAERRLGLPLDDRVHRERLRLVASESSVALVPTPRPAMAQIAEEEPPQLPPRPRGKSRCSRCETLKPLDCARANEMRHPADDDSDEPVSSALSRRFPSPIRSDTASLPCSPMAAGTPISTTMNAWSSTVTLSSSSVMSPTKPSGHLRRKESVILRKLFGAKGKEPEKTERHAQPTVREDDLGSWEVVDSDDLHTTSYSHRRPPMDREQSNASSWMQVTLPTSPVFINRPVRPFVQGPAPESSFAAKLSPAGDSPTGSQASGSEASPSEKPKQRRKPPPPPPPRKLRQSPSVVWKTSAPAGEDEASPQFAKPAPASDFPADKLPFPFATSHLSSRSRAASTLTPIMVPRKMLSHDDEAGPSVLLDASLAVPHTPATYASTLASDASGSPPASPSTPSHHYPGRPLPQVPHEPSPLASLIRIIIPHLSRPQAGNYSDFTDLDVLASRLEEDTRDGRNYEELLLLSEFAGPAHPPDPPSQPNDLETAPFLGRVEMQRRRILRDGRVKLKLTLLGTVVDRCGICLSQFKDKEVAALCVSCQKGQTCTDRDADLMPIMACSFHEGRQNNTGCTAQNQAAFRRHSDFQHSLCQVRLRASKVGEGAADRSTMASGNTNSPLAPYEIQRFIRASLDSPQTSPLTAVSAAGAQTVLDEIWKVLDSVALPIASSNRQFSLYRNKLRKLSLKLSITHNILPTTLILAGVECVGTISIGAGAFADVYIGTFRGEKVALKRLRVYVSTTESQKLAIKQLFYRESLLWKNLVHEHIVPFIGVSEDVFPGTVCMVLPWMENGSLRSYIVTSREKGELAGAAYLAAVETWLFQIVDGLLYLHDESLVHGDLHGGNVLIDGEGNARLADFGMALVSESTAYAYASVHGGGAMRWNAPELIDPEEFEMDTSRPTPASDIFSFASRRYVKGQRPRRPELPDGGTMSDAAWALTQACWAQKPADRPGTEEVRSRMLTIADIPNVVDQSADEHEAASAQQSAVPIPAYTSTNPQHLSDGPGNVGTVPLERNTSFLPPPPYEERFSRPANGYAPPPVPPYSMSPAATGPSHRRVTAQRAVEVSASRTPLPQTAKRQGRYVLDDAVRRLLRLLTNCDQDSWLSDGQGFHCNAEEHRVSFADCTAAEVEEARQKVFVKKRLKERGTCDLGLEWHQAWDAWRCGDRSHAVSFSAVEELLKAAGRRPIPTLITARSRTV
ncbi:hypothetical protein EIP91_000245 [Steccherinum ochraceum]|uniref:Protein kinase domain-containing protein n=1 Tax=Steccherinum ochraceum TaxID=92696 RepID=A0A4R0RWQ5_9APHY|nr:hypothetical protein EIP91_000245 [Steccherinum ochraceum]